MMAETVSVKHFEVLQGSNGMWVAFIGDGSQGVSASARRRGALISGPFESMKEAIKACDVDVAGPVPAINILPFVPCSHNDDAIAEALAARRMP
jgi:hypothetical protein